MANYFIYTLHLNEFSLGYEEKERQQQDFDFGGSQNLLSKVRNTVEITSFSNTFF